MDWGGGGWGGGLGGGGGGGWGGGGGGGGCEVGQHPSEKGDNYSDSTENRLVAEEEGNHSRGY